MWVSVDVRERHAAGRDFDAVEKLMRSHRVDAIRSFGRALRRLLATWRRIMTLVFRQLPASIPATAAPSLAQKEGKCAILRPRSRIRACHPLRRATRDMPRLDR